MPLLKRGIHNANGVSDVICPIQYTVRQSIIAFHILNILTLISLELALVLLLAKLLKFTWKSTKILAFGDFLVLLYFVGFFPLQLTQVVFLILKFYTWFVEHNCNFNVPLLKFIILASGQFWKIFEFRILNTHS